MSNKLQEKVVREGYSLRTAVDRHREFSPQERPPKAPRRDQGHPRAGAGSPSQVTEADTMFSNVPKGRAEKRESHELDLNYGESAEESSLNLSQVCFRGVARRHTIF